MNRSIRRALVLAGLLGTAAASHAQSSYSGTFRPYWYANNLYIEETNVTKGAIPACVTRPLLRLSADPASGQAKEQYTMLLAAWYTGRTLYIAGTGTCTTEGDEIILQISPL
jgi:hypothetical protein